ncbi:MAG: hypothetical protein A3E02_02345 [Candidatus Zambryskibacteria bacterium RIFCSPHIGHO2_12_FULL_38_34]|uniref:tRNA-binding domain-containing protein n=1 Tax=Candidatus Zambryskibacteria bacterium RIFCSPLOWO2_12_FULL_39_16 TaxID=1802775 RepID=A0A1G2US50_9BACT|nr:MAG: hypothetical protein A3E02_02345 [Candidatus Zambryskibacteria bacterium RIFCSPHIGHO2_12_FULL_38_34]OHB08605.1 MAG: hypothetical protein A3I19_00640 [Candidatus Zambryskibacteria bacterium RIFCSPLOWO2_02_FULL_38_13]OHB12235.1 MAG: hypothetical protein A3G46_01260 [Candidatus Zambryskibacteria bacterium RIFCSPLOWO2_12_FULL_39_16]
MITIDDFKKVEIRAGKIVSAEPIEGSEKLLKLSVDFGEEDIRQVISGIAKFVSVKELVGVICTFVTNLEPRKIMGLESQAMIMAFSGDMSPVSADEVQAGQFFSLLKVSENVPPGSIVR